MVDERTCHRAFRALLLANAYPGRLQPGPCSDAAAMLEALMDAVWCDDPRPPLVIDEGDAAELLAAADRGTEIEPERGATIARVVRGTCPHTAVRLAGPGVDGELRTSLALRPSEVAARAEACAAYPLGIDLVILEASGHVAALPRTVSVSLI
jgi:alpha-D-ribose 1-methylphosphonate 5-triphosphate synthase subunit PhnH